MSIYTQSTDCYAVFTYQYEPLTSPLTGIFQSVRFRPAAFETTRSHEIVRSGERSTYAAAGGRSSRLARERDDARGAHIPDNQSGLDARLDPSTAPDHTPIRCIPTPTYHLRGSNQRRRPTLLSACDRTSTHPTASTRRFARTSTRDRRRWPMTGRAPRRNRRSPAPTRAGHGLGSTIIFVSYSPGVEEALANSGSNPLAGTWNRPLTNLQPLSARRAPLQVPRAGGGSDQISNGPNRSHRGE